MIFFFNNELDMPAKATLFDHRANPVHEFGSSFRNTVKFNPQERHILSLCLYCD